jgi:heme o synthase
MIKTYVSLTKPGILMGNAITAIAGFFLATKGEYQVSLFWMLLGLVLIMASACAFNNCMDKEADKKMKRTKNRALARDAISQTKVVVFAVCLALAGIFVLNSYSTTLAMWTALFGFFVYVILYGLSKYRSFHGTLIGSISGAVPPVVGYAAVTGRLDLAAVLLFSMVALWQMPHFYAIALYRQEDYLAASIPVLPVKKGELVTKIHMLIYVTLFAVSSMAPAFFGLTGPMYLACAICLSLAWLALCLMGFMKNQDTATWARKMFFFSLIVITTLSFVIGFSGA